MEDISSCDIPLSKKLDADFLIFAQEEQQQNGNHSLDEREFI
jgi:hypothetical protein